MNSQSSQLLLSANDPPPVYLINPGGASTFLLIGDHAGNAVPSALGSLGLSKLDMTRHIAWDIGVAGLGEKLALALGTVFIRQNYSRLVIDCNRDPGARDAIPQLSDGTRVPGNYRMTAADRTLRVAEIHTPYQSAISAELAHRDASGRNTILVSLHSFTPSMLSEERPWEIGVLYSEGDSSFAKSMLRELEAHNGLVVGDNEPYAMDSVDYTIPRHAFAAFRRYVEIEVRQDLLVSEEHQAHWADLLAHILSAAIGDPTIAPA